MCGEHEHFIYGANARIFTPKSRCVMPTSLALCQSVCVEPSSPSPVIYADPFPPFLCAKEPGREAVARVGCVPLRHFAQAEDKTGGVVVLALALFEQFG